MEPANRKPRTLVPPVEGIALVLVAVLLGFSLTATFFFVRHTQVMRTQEAAQAAEMMRALEVARMHEAVAREAAAARRAADVQLQRKKE